MTQMRIVQRFDGYYYVVSGQETIAGPFYRRADAESYLQCEELRRAVMQRITAPHGDYCAWLTGGVCDCGVTESEERIDAAIRGMRGEE